MVRAVVLVALPAIVAALAAMPARACAACGCGTTAALPIGADVPFEGRLRTGLRITSTGVAGAGALADASLAAPVIALDVSRALTPWLVVDGTAPLQLRLRTHGGDVDGRSIGPGDASVGVRLVARDRGFAPRLVGSVRYGLTLPTSPVLHGAHGPLSTDLQPGYRELGSNLQLLGAWFPHPLVTAVAALTGALSHWTLSDARSAPLLDLRAALLWRVNDVVSVRAGAFGRVLGDEERSGRPVATARSASGPEVGVVVDIGPDVDVVVSAAIPVVNRGATQEGARADVGVVVDW